MKIEAVIIFLILLLGLILTCFLGNHFEGFTGNSFTGPNGNTAGYVKGANGNIYTNTNADTNRSNNDTSMTSSSNNGTYDNYNHYDGSSSPTVYYGPNGSTAKMIESNGVYSVIVTDGNGKVETYTVNTNTNTTTNSNVNRNTGTASTTTSGVNGSVTTFYGPNGGVARIVTKDNVQSIEVTDVNGAIVVYSPTNTYTYNPDYVNTTNSSTVSGYYGGSAGYVEGSQGGNAGYVSGPQGNSVGYATGPQGNSVGYATGPQGNTVVGSSVNGNTNTTSTNGSATNTDYSSVYAPGVGANQIPSGQEDLYILKSEIVPPVCPACPQSTACPRQEKCPPCPACARCPEPSFECKKVPNYNAINNEYLPVPVLNDFSTFGM